MTANKPTEEVTKSYHYFTVPTTIYTGGGIIGKGDQPTKGFQDYPNVAKLKHDIEEVYQILYPNTQLSEQIIYKKGP